MNKLEQDIVEIKQTVGITCLLWKPKNPIGTQPFQKCFYVGTMLTLIKTYNIMKSRKYKYLSYL